MKKFVALISIFLIFLSIAKVLPCAPVDFSTHEDTDSKECSLLEKCSISPHHKLCDTYTEVLHDAKLLSSSFSIIPSFIGQIFFQHVNVEEKSTSNFLDRPPISIS